MFGLKVILSRKISPPDWEEVITDVDSHIDRLAAIARDPGVKTRHRSDALRYLTALAYKDAYADRRLELFELAVELLETDVRSLRTDAAREVMAYVKASEEFPAKYPRRAGDGDCCVALESALKRGLSYAKARFWVRQFTADRCGSRHSIAIAKDDRDLIALLAPLSPLAHAAAGASGSTVFLSTAQVRATIRQIHNALWAMAKKDPPEKDEIMRRAGRLADRLFDAIWHPDGKR